ncbi:unnamed protein product [Caenorhabditis angaria]|uniref:Uncharacterized protein n=1 Tax=Caenorhabditis angaria TaxID=860376 RepID=A0A9P1MZ91_9PELO|nr:unnamed protein product [Caenorhabditis angaria]
MSDIIHQIITILCSFILFLVMSLTCSRKSSTREQAKPRGNRYLEGIQSPDCCDKKLKNTPCMPCKNEPKRPGKMSISMKKIKSKKVQHTEVPHENKTIVCPNQRPGYSKSTIAIQEAALSQIFNNTTNTSESDRANENVEKKAEKNEAKRGESKDEELLDLKDTQSPPRSE